MKAAVHSSPYEIRGSCRSDFFNKAKRRLVKFTDLMFLWDGGVNNTSRSTFSLSYKLLGFLKRD